MIFLINLVDVLLFKDPDPGGRKVRIRNTDYKTRKLINLAWLQRDPDNIYRVLFALKSLHLKFLTLRKKI